MRAMRAMRAMRSRRDEGDEDDDEGDGRQLGGFDDGGRPACGFPAAGGFDNSSQSAGISKLRYQYMFPQCSP